jgi:hypothetical protein
LLSTIRLTIANWIGYSRKYTSCNERREKLPETKRALVSTQIESRFFNQKVRPAKNKNGGDWLSPILAVLCDLLLLRSALHKTDDSTALFPFQRFRMASHLKLWIIGSSQIQAVGAGSWRFPR